ncbi:MAG: hypothetical protein ACOVQQ_00215 [Flavobacterium sp.]
MEVPKRKKGYRCTRSRGKAVQVKKWKKWKEWKKGWKANPDRYRDYLLNKPSTRSRTSILSAQKTLNLTDYFGM